MKITLNPTDSDKLLRNIARCKKLKAAIPGIRDKTKLTLFKQELQRRLGEIKQLTGDQ